MNLVPYSYSGEVFNDVEYSSRSTPVAVVTRPGLAVGVHILVHPEATEAVADRFERWFARRGEVNVVDVGNLEKSKVGFIILEWLECDVDQLFLDILDNEEAVVDYSLYGRNLEG
jgi:hypothetical protein